MDPSLRIHLCAQPNQNQIPTFSFPPSRSTLNLKLLNVLPKHCPRRGDHTVHTRRGDVSPFPNVPAGRLGCWEFSDPAVHELEKSHRTPDRQNHWPQLHREKVWSTRWRLQKPQVPPPLVSTKWALIYIDATVVVVAVLLATVAQTNTRQRAYLFATTQTVTLTHWRAPDQLRSPGAPLGSWNARLGAYCPQREGVDASGEWFPADMHWTWSDFSLFSFFSLCL